MKKLICLLLTMILLCSFCSCGGSFSAVDLQKPVEIPEDGIIEEKILKQLKDENTIGTFYASDGDYTYEWTIFGSDIPQARDLNLKLEFLPSQNHTGVQFRFAEEEPVGFPAVLSIHTGSKWDALNATVYHTDSGRPEPVCTASVTGQDETILNFSAEDRSGSFVILPDEEQQEAIPEEGASAEEEEPSGQAALPGVPVKEDSYTSSVTGSSGDRVYSDGTGTEQDEFHTDPVPEGKPLPVEPDDQDVDESETFTCTFSIECSTILNNLENLDPDKRELVPSDGVILKKQKVTFHKGESVFDVLQNVCNDNGIHMEAEWTPMYNSAYVEGIHNLYEFDCGQESGWMYRVNGWYPNYGCSRYQLQNGDVVEWRYTCNGLGKDIGCDWMQ